MSKHEWDDPTKLGHWLKKEDDRMVRTAPAGEHYNQSVEMAHQVAQHHSLPCFFLHNDKELTVWPGHTLEQTYVNWHCVLEGKPLAYPRPVPVPTEFGGRQLRSIQVDPGR